VRTIIKEYDYGMAPVLVFNCLKNLPISIKQFGENEDSVFIMPDQYFMVLYLLIVLNSIQFFMKILFRKHGIIQLVIVN
jgi:uncharacterized membrane-anchored protein